jgi:adsorption protein A
MKSRSSKRLATASLLVVSVLYSSAPLAENASSLELSEYRYFVIYPHFEKALKAQKNNDEQTALREFRHIHKQAPDNIPLTLYLAEAQRHFGHDDRARALLDAQLKKFPNDTRLARALNAIPVKVAPVTNREQLLAQQQRCEKSPTPQCRNEVGQNALRLNELDIAVQQLNDARFAASEPGKRLRQDIIGRAIHQQEWEQADAMFSALAREKSLTPAQEAQWFNVLIAGKRDDRLQQLQTQGLMNSTEQRINYATALAERGERQRLARYLAQPQPRFQSAGDEKRWLYLLSRYSENPRSALAGFQPRFAENQRYLAGVELPELLRERRYQEARQRLNALPADEWLNERFALSIALGDNQNAVALARRLRAQSPGNLALLDSLSYQLISIGQQRAAADMLLTAWPWRDSGAQSERLLQRLIGLIQQHPDWASPTQMASLLRPHASPDRRNLQARLLNVNSDCGQVSALLGDLSPRYDAASWQLLATCYQKTLPGMALYAFQQSEQRQPDKFTHSAVALQAWEVQDYRRAVQAWSTIPIGELDNPALFAAANSAQAAGDGAARDRWLDELRLRGATENEAYWWLHSRRYLPDQPQQALADIDKALAIEPTTRALLSRAEIYRQQGEPRKALADLQAAEKREPDNAAIQAALGYSLWDNNQMSPAREALEKARASTPDDPMLVKQLAYVNQRLDDAKQTRHYAERVVDNIDYAAAAQPLDDDRRQERYNFRRLHEDVGRRWSFSLDSTVGLRSGATSAANNNLGGQPGQSYRSYGQMEAEYRIGRNMLLDGDLLSVYSRLYADTGSSGVVMPVKNPFLGTGVRWKPLRDYIFFLALEQQIPLGNGAESDTMLRASASFFNGGKYSDEWHPNGRGWLAQNLYLDAAHYIRQDNQAYTADYRISWHHKVAHGQTVEPYTHVQASAWRDGYTRTTYLGGVGVRWNTWSGETHYDAWPHKVSVGVEYQRTFRTVNQSAGERNNLFLTLGVHW